ncbi:MAG: PHP domain-containing protein [Solirubrobacterales bacterium]
MPYVELHCHSAYSFLDGASLPEELAVRAAELGYPALGLTDHDGVGGAMEHVHACRGLGLRGLAGAEITVGSSTADPDRETTASRGSWSHGRGSTHPPHLDPASAPPGGFHVTVLVAEPVGWRNLCRLLTIAHRHTRDGPQRSALPPAVSLAELEAHAEGLICLSGCARDGALARPLEAGQGAIAEARGRRLLGAFGPERFRVELQRPLWRRDRARNRALAQLAERLGVPTVATGNVHAHSPARARLQDALSAVRLGGGLDQTEPRRRGNHAHLLLDPTAAAARFADHPEAVAETERIAERLEFDLASDLGYRYPGAEDEHADRDLAELCRQRFAGRYDGTPERAEAEDRLAEELRLIRELGLSGFFLLHHDLLELAAEVAVEVRGPSAARRLLPPGRGRGSSVSSVVCYLTGLSHVDPVRNQLFLGRFLNDEITALPDIDLDFPRDVREVLIPRIHERYGHERSALVAAVNCYRSRGAVRDLGKALGLPAGEIERVARSVEIHADPAQVARDVASAIGAERAASGRWKWLIELAREAWQLPRHLSQHPGGMVLATQPLVDVCPVQPAAM